MQPLIFEIFIALCLITNGYSNESESKPEPYDQGHIIKDTQMMQAYNAPARIDTTKKIDTFAKVSFLYIQPKEDGLDLGRLVSVFPEDFNEEVIRMNLDYKPGFKIGLGLSTEFDNWSYYLEYTRLHTSNSSTIDNDAFRNIEIYRDFGGGSRNSSSSVNATWKLEIDLFDLELARAEYVGTHLIFKPLLGLRSGWIDQSFDAIYTLTGSGDANSNQKSTSWLIGPRAGIDSRWFIYKGFNLFGNFSSSILYQRFDVSSIFDNTALSNTVLSNISDNDQGYLRANFDIDLGLSWGSYFRENKVHLIFDASYSFQIFWDQNMMRYLRDTSTFGINAAISNLFLHGLDISARLDF